MKHIGETMVNESVRNTWINVEDTDFLCLNTDLNSAIFYNKRDIKEMCETTNNAGEEKKIYNLEVGETYLIDDNILIMRIHY